MQSLAFLWFQLQMTQQYLNEKTFRPAQSPANPANLNSPTGADTLQPIPVFKKIRRAAWKPVAPQRTQVLKQD